MSRPMLERILVVAAVLAVAVAGTTPAAAATPRSPEVCTADPGYDHCVRYAPADGVDATFLVPEGVSSVHAMAWGAGGGRALRDEMVDPSRQWGGGGGYAEGDIPVSPGEKLTVGAGSGGQPGDRSVVPAGGAGFLGADGGSGGVDATSVNYYLLHGVGPSVSDVIRGAGGGGASGVARADGQELLLAGGGGGGAYSALWDGGAAGGDMTPGNGRGATGDGGIGGAGGRALTGELVAYSIPGEQGGPRRGGAGGGGGDVHRGGGGGGGGYGGGGGGVSWQMVSGTHTGSGGGGGNGLGIDVDGDTRAGSGATPGHAEHRLRTSESGLGASGAQQAGGPGLVVLQWAAVHELTVVSGDQRYVQPGESFDALSVAARIGSGAAAPSASVTFTVVDDGGTGTTFDGGDRVVVVTDADGIARTDRALVAGADTGEVRVRAEAGAASVDFALAVGPVRAESVVMLSGAGQSAERGATFADVLAARVESVRGLGVPDVPVTFTIEGATGSTFAPSDGPGVRVAADGSSVTVTTVDDPETPGRTGTAIAPAIVAGVSPGSFAVVIDAAGVTGSTRIELEVVAGAVTGLQIAGGDEQSVAPYTAFDHNLRVQAYNSSGAPVQGVPVTFAIQGPTGSTFADGTTSTVSTSDLDGLAGSLRVLAGDSGQVTVAATVAGGPSVTFYLTVTGSTHLGLDPLTLLPR